MQHATDTVHTRFESPLGPMLLGATPRGLSGVWFDGQQHLPDWQAWPSVPANPVFGRTAQQLGEYFAGTREVFELPLDLSGGTPFQQSVWRALLGIGYGASTSYGAIAAFIDNPAAVRAVGAAVGRNPISIIVPCHRVLGANGALTGYAGGLARKTALLSLESRTESLL